MSDVAPFFHSFLLPLTVGIAVFVDSPVTTALAVFVGCQFLISLFLWVRV